MTSMATEESDVDSIDQPTNNIVPSFSFSGCGFLGVYHVGVAACLRDHTDVVNRREIKFAGASAGALVATTLLCDIDFGEMTKLLLDVAKVVRNKEPIDLAALLKDLLNKYLPDDAHIRLRNRLYVSMTILRGLECGLVTNFQSKEHLIQCLIASSFVPGFVGWIPPGLEGEDFVDVADSVLPNMSPPEESETDDSEGTCSMDEDDGDFPKQTAAMKKKSSSCIDIASMWDVCGYDDDDDCDGCNNTTTIGGRVKVRRKKNESYINMLVRLCFMGLHTTTRVVRNVPGASHIIDTVVPKGLSGLDGFMEALLLEMMSNRYTVFDGGFSDNIPCFDSNTITVCPFAGESDICPRDFTAIDFNIDLGRTSMHASEDNIFRLNHALNPMDPEMLLKLCEEGYNECLRFLNRKDLLSCKKHLMTRATISSSPCNIGHAHCHCKLCRSVDSKIRTSLSCVNCHKTKQKALMSILPEDVRREFGNAIAEYKEQNRCQTVTYWNKLISLLWWCAEKMYAGTIRFADLAIDFYAWLLRFWDNIASFAKLAILPMGKKRQLVRYILSSMKSFLASAARGRTQRACSIHNLHSVYS